MVLVRFAVFVVGLAIAMLLAAEVSSWIRARRQRPPRPQSPRPLPRPGPAAAPTLYDWERRTDQLKRKVKGIQGPAEDREGILGFIESRAEVEAYIEPKTVMHPLSVVLVAKDGEWRRFELTDDSYLRQLRRTHGLPIYDAVRVGYPERMRKYRKQRADPPPDES